MALNAYWAFKNVLTDLSANAYTLTNSSTTFSSGRIPNDGCLNVNGLTNANRVYVDSNVFGTAPFTISFWAKRTQVGGASGHTLFGIVTQSISGGNRFFLDYQTTDFRMRFGHDGSSYKAWTWTPSVDLLPLNKWVHVCGVCDTADTPVLYINGVSGGSLVSSADGTTATATRLSIGQLANKDGTTSNYYGWGGMVDNVIVENTAWTAAEVLEYYNKNSWSTYGSFLNDSSLVMYCPMDGNSADFKGNAMTDTNCTYAIGGRFGQALTLAGNGKVTITHTSAFSPSEITLACWFYRATDITNTWECLFGQSNPTVTDPYWIGIWGSSANSETNTFYCGITDTAGLTGSWVIPLSNSWTSGEWHHLVYTYKPTGSGGLGTSVYCDGKKLSIKRSGLNDNTSIGSKTYNPTIGAFRYTTQYFNGKIENVYMFSREFSPAEAKRLYALGRGYYGPQVS